MNVIDASVLASFIVRDKFYREAERLLTSLNEIVVPDIIVVEVSNVIWKHIYHFKRIDYSDGLKLLDILIGLLQTFKVVSNESLLRGSVELSLELGIPIYDSLYVYLAIDRRAKLYTFDDKLKEILSKSSYNWLLP